MTFLQEYAVWLQFARKGSFEPSELPETVSDSILRRLQLDSSTDSEVRDRTKIFFEVPRERDLQNSGTQIPIEN